MTKKKPKPATTPVQEDLAKEVPIHAPKAEQRIDRMKLASEPNDGEPLAHRNRSKAGRKG